jgi:hypothetical protein
MTIPTIPVKGRIKISVKRRSFSNISMDRKRADGEAFARSSVSTSGGLFYHSFPYKRVILNKFHNYNSPAHAQETRVIWRP